MEKWAREYSGVRFLTVCVDVQGVAKQFAAMFQFNKVVNCHIPSKGYFPRGKLMRSCVLNSPMFITLSKTPR